MWNDVVSSRLVRSRDHGCVLVEMSQASRSAIAACRCCAGRAAEKEAPRVLVERMESARETASAETTLWRGSQAVCSLSAGWWGRHDRLGFSVSRGKWVRVRGHLVY